MARQYCLIVTLVRVDRNISELGQLITSVCSKTMQVLFEVQALGDFPGEEDEDLGFKDREILTILESRYIFIP